MLDRLLSYGQSDAIPEWLGRRVRITNALALLGILLTLTGMPVDAMGATPKILVLDVACISLFAACWLLNARGRHLAARVLFTLTANAVITGGMFDFGGFAELRTVYFPLVVMSFFVFDINERGWLTVAAVLPMAEYFLTARVSEPPSGFAMDFNLIYAPVLAFTMLIAGAAVFAYIQRAAELKLQHTLAKAAQGARLAALGEMSSGIAHEIRNPLAAIHIAATQIAEHSGNPAQVAQLGERIQRIVMRASTIIEGLRSFARDASTDPFVDAAVGRIISDTLELCGKRFASNGVALTVADVPDGLTAKCRPVQISQVLMNLLGNAYDAVATSAERWVRIDVAAEDDQLEISVSDSGPGVAPELRSRIFEPFFTTKAVDRGTGLGLSLSRGIVEAHRGTLELDSAAPHTRFVVRLPRAQPAA